MSIEAAHAYERSNDLTQLYLALTNPTKKEQKLDFVTNREEYMDNLNAVIQEAIDQRKALDGVDFPPFVLDTAKLVASLNVARLVNGVPLKVGAKFAPLRPFIKQIYTTATHYIHLIAYPCEGVRSIPGLPEASGAGQEAYEAGLNDQRKLKESAMKTLEKVYEVAWTKTLPKLDNDYALLTPRDLNQTHYPDFAFKGLLTAMEQVAPKSLQSVELPFHLEEYQLQELCISLEGRKITNIYLILSADQKEYTVTVSLALIETVLKSLERPIELTDEVRQSATEAMRSYQNAHSESVELQGMMVEEALKVIEKALSNEIDRDFFRAVARSLTANTIAKPLPTPQLLTEPAFNLLAYSLKSWDSKQIELDNMPPEYKDRLLALGKDQKAQIIIRP